MLKKILFSSLLVTSSLAVLSSAKAMEEKVERATASLSTKFIKGEFCEYDFNNLEAAEKVVSQASFIPEVKKEFTSACQFYDRNKFLEYDKLKGEAQDQYLIELDPKYIETLSFFKDHEDYEGTKKLFTESAGRVYEPYLKNINYMVNHYGRFDTRPFDAFFYHLVGIHYSVNTDHYLQWPTYNDEEINSFLGSLEKVGFLKDKASILSLKRSYTVANQVEKFMKAQEKDKPPILVIGEGHRGITGIESISRFQKNCFTVDMNAFVLPNSICDINSSELLDTLNMYGKGSFSFIYDKTNMPSKDVFKESTLDRLVSLLAPGGQFKKEGISLNRIEPEVAKQLIEKHGLAPIYNGEKENPEDIIALEKK